MLSIKAFAKINLYLDVISRYPDGYHQIESVMQSVSLFDTIDLTPASDINIVCTNKELETRDNLAFKAAELLRAKTGTGAGVTIGITKRIPMAAGLAGGSADAAATLIGLNEMWGLGLSLSEIQEIGIILGADVPFCCAGGSMFAQGKGEKLSKLPSLPPVEIVLTTPSIRVSTADIYRGIDEINPKPLDRRNEIISALDNKDELQIAQSLGNILEKVALPEYPQIVSVKRLANEIGCPGVLMSGSGPSVFALCSDISQASNLAGTIRAWDEGAFVEIVRPVECGTVIV